MIRLDVSVVDGRGRPVSGLGALDFEVAEDGRPVDIALFEAVEEGRALPAKRPAAESSSNRRSLCRGGSSCWWTRAP